MRSGFKEFVLAGSGYLLSFSDQRCYLFLIHQTKGFHGFEGLIEDGWLIDAGNNYRGGKIE